MMRSPQFLLSIALFSAWPVVAEAQRGTTTEERSSIQTEADWATALYVESVVSSVGGLTAGLALWGVSFGHDVGPCPACDAAIACLSLAGIGLATLAIAIGLDVDARSRRRASQPRGRSAVELTVGPSQFALRWRF